MSLFRSFPRQQHHSAGVIISHGVVIFQKYTSKSHKCIHTTTKHIHNGTFRVSDPTDHFWKWQGSIQSIATGNKEMRLTGIKPRRLRCIDNVSVAFILTPLFWMNWSSKSWSFGQFYGRRPKRGIRRMGIMMRELEKNIHQFRCVATKWAMITVLKNQVCWGTAAMPSRMDDVRKVDWVKSWNDMSWWGLNIEWKVERICPGEA